MSNMVVGDLVKWNDKTGVIIRVFEQKIWRTKDRGMSVNFEKVEPEPFAEILVKGKTLKVPQSDLTLMR